ncbi:TetR/AcrR family transcriptional regulator [Candidatus Bipolaricaulota bacterium]|nr:TetR/AcrR family transcriptional regulator [Candidatus Bipolaricaulota bacterium]
MPRAFREDERVVIRERLLSAGRELFSRYGLRKTTVEELARAAGIAKGTFYLFFPSKEALYGEVLLSVIPEMVERLFSRSFGRAKEVRQALVLYQKELVRLIEENELVRAITADRGSWEDLFSADWSEYRRRGMEALRPLVDAIKAAQARGEVVEGDPWELVQILGLIKILPLYKEQVLPELYPRLVDRVAEVIADGLTCPARRKG